ncbi:hypothetical protein CROQUDRAFT_56214 [Cronartium quercuum f. sp. fusiforme G11]|uniref:BTB domain-containing protein n=1 Tax=Cronartium quercuum f. sp. fusiforme G11 TaxID=708437 RepID=A0A9P6TIX4_9BASI|nr:hypothetical protein CROQUDRAFT_56214 [Cronartium quercuum f. sp. fusiforme G11]
MNPSTLLLARTPPVASTSTYSTHIPSARPSDHFQTHLISNTSPISSPPNHQTKRSSNETTSLPNLHPTFKSDGTSQWPIGTVEIIVEYTTFLVHKEVIIFASPFFESVLSGEWAETSNCGSKKDKDKQKIESKQINSNQTNSIMNNNNNLNLSELSNNIEQIDVEINRDEYLDESRTIGPHNNNNNNNNNNSIQLSRSESFTSNSSLICRDSSNLISNHNHHHFELSKPLNFDQILSTTSTPTSSKTSSEFEEEEINEEELYKIETFPHCNNQNNNDHDNNDTKNRNKKIEARIILKEEKAAAFQDLLMFVYPHLECVCTWNNAPELMTMSRKFDMPYLKRHVLNFLLSSAAGKPIQAMKIAEDHQLNDLYRESSRFLLDNWQGWDPKELDCLTSETLLKLEKRRTWFLERLLKLGLVNSSRDYVCPPTCSDPQHCAKLVDDKWRSAWAASFKFGPPQPSSVYRALRCLEPSLHSPSLLLPHTSCQQHAIRFFADLFDRMFSQFPPRAHTHSNSSHHILNEPSNSGSNTTTNSSSNAPLLKPSRHAKYFLHVELFDGKDRDRR